jgi:hypothetical protein
MNLPGVRLALEISSMGEIYLSNELIPSARKRKIFNSSSMVRRQEKSQSLFTKPEEMNSNI